MRSFAQCKPQKDYSFKLFKTHSFSSHQLRLFYDTVQVVMTPPLAFVAFVLGQTTYLVAYVWIIRCAPNNHS